MTLSLLNKEIRDIQPPESIESLLTMVYELRYGEDSYCVNNEACRIVCQKFLNQVRICYTRCILDFLSTNQSLL